MLDRLGVPALRREGAIRGVGPPGDEPPALSALFNNVVLCLPRMTEPPPATIPRSG